MFEIYEDEAVGGIFVRHHGKFEGAEHLAALAYIAEVHKTGPSPVKFIWLDACDVEEASLYDTDRAFKSFSRRRFNAMSLPDPAPRIVRVLSESSPAFSMLLQRDNRNMNRQHHETALNVGGEYVGEVPGYFASFTTLEKAKDFVGLSADFLPDWSRARPPLLK